MADELVQSLFDQAYKLREERQAIIEQQAAVRGSLRNLSASGVLTEEQQEEVRELFPPRTRRSRTEDDEYLPEQHENAEQADNYTDGEGSINGNVR